MLQNILSSYSTTHGIHFKIFCIYFQFSNQTINSQVLWPPLNSTPLSPTAVKNSSKYYHEFRTGLILGWWLQGRQWYTTVNGKLYAAQERQTKSLTSTTGTNTTSRSIQSTNRTKELKDGTRKRQNKPEEAPKTLCLKNRDIR